ncbi:hypothetical protein LTR64_007084 [Lithohypha guttulata]|uniref:uncharacterized protein n=1 Tax=Lithohypha guttulata TaxID=1690604 RepID=UPI002DE00E4B|nr:hypothetical protein LTR51_004360 [Lithohypha guttulata]
MASAAQHASSSMSLSITNPLVLYRALIATRRIRPDPAQHRLALELQNLYYRLKDYDPEVEYRWRLERAAKVSRKSADGAQRKPVYEPEPGSKRFSMSSILGLDERTASMMALIRTIPVHDSAMDIDSPQGMLLYGEVGRDVFRRLEMTRIERTASPEGLALDHEHVILSLARDTMDTSPILFLDEFQMPDRVSGKLVHSFFTHFFSLGGVLIASSNRMPEELAKASGVEFSRMFGAPRWGRGGQIWEKLSVGQQQARTDFGKFVDVLKKRCEIWEMEGERDWRREDSEMAAAIDAENGLEMDEEEAETILEKVAETSISPSSTLIQEAESATASADMPTHYHIADPPSPGVSLPTQSVALQAALSRLNSSNIWHNTTLTVYARPLHLQSTNLDLGIALLPFPNLCQSNLGPADYISICSTFHTLVVTHIPILTLLMKNEARRFITFLDACYEARCRLLIEADAPPDRLFFPETRAKRGAANMLAEGDSIESEAFSEMYQDSTAPFRPNISSYVGSNKDDRQSVPNPTTSLYNKDLRSVLADEDADFGPTYGNRRSSSGVSSSASDYDDDGSSLLDERHRLPQGMADLELRQGPDFTQGAGIFTGQDEQFAYKRARSRLWEMCGRRWWDERQGRDARDWWTPVNRDARFWEKSSSNASVAKQAVDDLLQKQGEADATPDGKAMQVNTGPSNMSSKEKEDSLFRHGASPFRTSAEAPPKFGFQHAWGMMTWGKRAGEWGKGVEGDRSKEKSNKT